MHLHSFLEDMAESVTENTMTAAITNDGEAKGNLPINQTGGKMISFSLNSK